MQQLQIDNQDANLTQRKLDKNQGFISKLKQMLNDQKFKDVIHILESNDGFIIMNLQKFIAQVIPEYFKKINYQSFRRQLNYYGFKCLNKEKNSVEYVNKQFNIHSETEIKKIIKINSDISDNNISFNQLEELRLNQLILLKQIGEIKIQQQKILKNTQINTIKYLQSQIRSEYRRQNMQNFCVRFYKSINNPFFKQFFDKNFLNAAKQTQYAYDDDFFVKHFFQYQPIQIICIKNQDKDTNNIKVSINQYLQNDDENQFDDKLSISNLSAYFDL